MPRWNNAPRHVRGEKFPISFSRAEQERSCQFLWNCNAGWKGYFLSSSVHLGSPQKRLESWGVKLGILSGFWWILAEEEKVAMVVGESEGCQEVLWPVGILGQPRSYHWKGSLGYKYKQTPALRKRISGWQKLCEGTLGLSRKVWTPAKNLKP